MIYHQFFRKKSEFDRHKNSRKFSQERGGRQGAGAAGTDKLQTTTRCAGLLASWQTATKHCGERGDTILGNKIHVYKSDPGDIHKASVYLYAHCIHIQKIQSHSSLLFSAHDTSKIERFSNSNITQKIYFEVLQTSFLELPPYTHSSKN